MYAVIARVIAAVLVFLQQTYYWTGNDDAGSPSTSAMHDLRITGLILARAGSKGIEHKNMQDLNGLPLIHWSLKAMIDSEVFHEIWVSTDDPQVKQYAKKLGVHVHDRASYTATDQATSISAVQEFLEKHPAVHNIGLIQCTSPFILPEYLMEASERMVSGECDSVFSVTRSHQLRWSVAVDEHFASKPLNFDPKYRPRRQDWEGEFVENGMFYFTRRSVIEKGALQSSRSCIVEIFKKHSLEIDTPQDLKVARILIKDLKQASQSPDVADGLIENLFFAFKTPLRGSEFDVSCIINHAKQKQWNIGLWIDLTNTKRYYNPNDVEKAGVVYRKFMLAGQESPSAREINEFLSCIQEFRSKNPIGIIGIHCTHGFNRTGYLICSYLCKVMRMDPHEAFLKFRQMRPPGMYRQNMVNDLCRTFSTTNSPPPAVVLPAWKSRDRLGSRRSIKIYKPNVDESGNGNWRQMTRVAQTDMYPRSRHIPPPEIYNGRRTGNVTPDVVNSKGRSSTRWNNVAEPPVIEIKKPIGIQETLQKCSILIAEDKSAALLQSIANLVSVDGCIGNQFSLYQRLTAGSFPILKENSYTAAWYPSQSFRYFLFADSEGEIYIIDSKLRIRYAPLLNLPDSVCITTRLHSTLIEGLLVERKIGKASTETELSFEITDVLAHKGVSMGAEAFQLRIKLARESIVGARKKLAKESPILFTSEPFTIGVLQFWTRSNASKLLQYDLQSSYRSDPRGFLFIPSSENSQNLPKLEWTGAPTTRAHFRLRNECSQEKRYFLHVDDEEAAIAELQVESPDASHFDRLADEKLIVECTLDFDKRWKYVRKSVRHYSDPKTFIDDILNGSLRENMPTAHVFEYLNALKTRTPKPQKDEQSAVSENPSSSSSDLHEPPERAPHIFTHNNYYC